jgi:serine/threonine-protein kinase
MHYYFLKAESAWFRRRAALERAYADSLRSLLERGLRTEPEDPYTFHRLGFAYAALGRKADAVRAARRAVELMPASRDALIGPYFAVGLARTYMMVGEPDRAVETLAPLLEIPSPITRAGLGADPLWAPLQKHPVFQKLIAEVKQPAE